MATSLSGLASGLDSESMITQLMAIERQPKTRMAGLQARVEARRSGLDEVGAKLRTLQAAVAALHGTTTWKDVQTVGSSDATRLGARQLAEAAPGGYVVNVTRLARAEQRTYTYTSSPSASQITVSGLLVDVPAGADATAAAAAINARADVAVYATATNAGTLVLSGKAEGASFTASSARMTQTAVRAAQTAAYTVDGRALTSTSNTVKNEIPGVELTFKATGSQTVTVGAPALDAEAVKTKLRAFVDAYNSTVDLVRNKLGEKTVASPTNTVDWRKGALSNDTVLSGVLSSLRQELGKVVAGNAASLDQLSELGISVPSGSGGTSSPDALAGKLVLDETKLAAVLTSDPAGARRLLGGGGQDGVGQRLEAILAPIARVADGLLARRATEADAQVARIQKQSAELDTRLEAKEKRLRAQFTALETAMSRAQTQGSWLAGQLAAL